MGNIKMPICGGGGDTSNLGAINITAYKGSLLSCGGQTYQLESDETTHTFIIKAGTYTVSASWEELSSSQSVTVAASSFQNVTLNYSVTVIFTGEGDYDDGVRSKYCSYCTIGGSRYYTAGSTTMTELKNIDILGKSGVDGVFAHVGCKLNGGIVGTTSSSATAFTNIYTYIPTAPTVTINLIKGYKAPAGTYYVDITT